MAASLTDENGSVIEGFSAGIRAEGRRIDAGATSKHGISSTYADRNGIYEIFALGAVCGLKAGGKRTSDYPGMASSARTLICWDAAFTKSVIAGLFLRHGEPASAWLRPGLQTISLQQIASPWCRLPASEGGYRMPRRDEAISTLLGLPERKTPNSPDSNLDMEKLIYFWLRDHKAMESAAA